ncbi:MAG: chromosomal replication initiator protein DnaA [Alphaproteobacteria bacterium]|nr:chromosomal replication initiator protein DnaA [Alphaproteobacteria bacterium]
MESRQGFYGAGIRGSAFGIGDVSKATHKAIESVMEDKQTPQWIRVRGKLRAEFGEAAYRSWLKPISLVSAGRGVVRISAPTKFMRDWVEQQYGDRLAELRTDEDPTIQIVEIVHDTGGAPLSRPRPATPSAQPRTDKPEGSVLTGAASRAIAANGRDEEIGAMLDKRFDFASFVVGKPNELAFAAARRVAEADAATFNPLFLYGGVGLGKTHLMHAIAWHIRTTQPEKKVIYLSAEKFMYQFIRAMRYKDTMAFKEQFRSVDVLMIDDVQFFAGKDSTQEEFFHTFNALVDQNRQVVVSADKSPNDLEGMEERMKSRLGWGLVADIHPTTYELRLGILQVKAEGMGVEVPAKVLEFLAHKITSNVRELEGALNRIIAYANLVGRSLTLDTAQEVLQDVLRANNRRVTIEEIQKRVAEHFNIRLGEMYSARRSRAIARPRQVAMYLSKQLTARSLPDIGRQFGGRDHTTVMHAVRKIDELRASDSAFSDDIDLLRRMLEG